MTNIHHYTIIFKCLEEINITSSFKDIAVKHFITIIITVFMKGYNGKTVDFEKYSLNHRTTIAYFLNNGKWNTQQLEDILKMSVINVIYNEALCSGKPIYCIVDDTIASKTKPSSKALNPIQDAYFHQSHLKKKQDYGHQAVSVMLSCNGITLNYAFVMYNKAISKVDIVKNIAEELPEAPVVSYFLCDCWYTSLCIMNAFLQKGFYTVGAIKTNRIIYPCGIKQQIKNFASFMRETDRNIDLVTVGKRQFYVYRYEGKINGITDTVVLISYPKEAFGNPIALRAFISTDTSLTTEEILNIYTNRWQIEVFFRQTKDKLAIDKYQIRKSLGIRRYWLLMSLTHFLCCNCTGKLCSFEEGYNYFAKQLKKEYIRYIYDSGKNNIPFEEVLALVG